MITKWDKHTQSGYIYYQCQCPQFEGSTLERLFGLCYAPQDNKLWFWLYTGIGSDTIRMTCKTWADAELIKSMLTTGKSHWMDLSKGKEIIE